MNNFYIIPFIFFGFITQAQIVNIPDANFKNALVNTICADTTGDGIINSKVDLNNDGEIQESEALAVFGLMVRDQDISSVEGIQSFTNLIKLDVRKNQLTNINLSQNLGIEELNCRNNLLTSLDVSHLLDLKTLECSSNFLTSLDVSQNSLLENFYCAGNQLTYLDVTNNPYLQTFAPAGNLLTTLDMSQNPNLYYMLCHENLLTELDLSQNPKLSALICEDNQLVSLNIKNGNNHMLHDLWTERNPNLNCIQVDDINHANNQSCGGYGLTWCKSPWTYYSEDCNLGTQDFSLQSYTIYPNPSQNILNINSKEPIDSVRIYSTNGSLIKESASSTSSIDVSKLSKGLYFIQVILNGNSATKKFIKD
ncbi:T9SS type A sorting domain-containing protein [Aequorivita sinensis]|uniref:T9SS type A sorting domain-containing protein n=1 Tax=Aequorivita sinensis TaxID=1382458 RepID=UPI0011229E14|nr:T9SS type A sorting domain-containing protein [Aequorivita sinensis]